MIKEDVVRTRILRAATALYNACIKTLKENGCKGCPFSLRGMGCDLYDHPTHWKDKLKEAKQKKYI